MNPLKLRPEDCSAFGQLVLQYLQENPQTNMSQLAKQVRISRAGLGWICLKRSGIEEETARRVAHAIGADMTKVARLVYENKLENLMKVGGLNYVAKLDNQSIKKPIPIGDAIAGLNSVFHAFHYVTRSVPEVEKPTDFQIYKQAFDIVKTQFLKDRKIPKT
ncbi:MAG: winged helix-turn-helix domain-containing protein [Candidatus Parcubacteria bacterium]|uniref:winged helix-turn-helix domain-containing protein n=1 Tax=Phormidesmis priestleyi TaxID=268141 RepID=UPI00083A7511|nr:winged helix-turn-helix domain-containing protein [Phormidesmis priestleyi]MBC7823932.1 winged helix-turn-helix domain-containing protein [Leptolyngbyaceae cyanobacterium LF-bin-113]